MIANEPIEHATRLLRVHLVHVDLEGIGERRLDGFLGHLIERQSLALDGEDGAPPI